MKKTFKFSLSIILIVVSYSIWGIILTHKNQTREFTQDVLKINQPCAKPLTFSVGAIDPRFGVSKNTLEKSSQQAADIWNKAAGKKLLQYDSHASFKINLVFDQRQAQTLEESKLEENLKNLKLTNEDLAKQYDALHNTYSQKVIDYKKSVSSYKKRLDEYNQKVDYWNSQGGASKDVYDDLQKEKKKLKDLYSSLEKQRDKINNLVGKTNNLAAQENQIVNQYNSKLVTYKSEFGASREFEKGVFDTREINIYQFKKMSDLRLTLAHELGHYLGLQHVQNSKSIMYYLIGDQELNNPAPTDEDMAELDKVCNIKSN